MIWYKYTQPIRHAFQQWPNSLPPHSTDACSPKPLVLVPYRSTVCWLHARIGEFPTWYECPPDIVEVKPSIIALSMIALSEDQFPLLNFYMILNLPMRVDMEQCGIVGVRYTNTRFPATWISSGFTTRSCSKDTGCSGSVIDRKRSVELSVMVIKRLGNSGGKRDMPICFSAPCSKTTHHKSLVHQYLPFLPPLHWHYRYRLLLRSSSPPYHLTKLRGPISSILRTFLSLFGRNWGMMARKWWGLRCRAGGTLFSRLVSDTEMVVKSNEAGSNNVSRIEIMKRDGHVIH